MSLSLSHPTRWGVHSALFLVVLGMAFQGPALGILQEGQLAGATPLAPHERVALKAGLNPFGAVGRAAQATGGFLKRHVVAPVVGLAAIGTGALASTLGLAIAAAGTDAAAAGLGVGVIVMGGGVIVAGVALAAVGGYVLYRHFR